MKFLLSILTLAFFSFASASLFNGQTILEEKFPVPGKNPLLFCTDPSNDILTVEDVELAPNPPLPGKTLKIEAHGVFKEKVEKDAYMYLTVKYGLVRIIYQKEDLCDQLKNNVDQDCPVGPGPVKFTKEVDIPAQVPPGKYTVQADVFTKDDVKITCLKAEIQFNRPGSDA